LGIWIWSNETFACLGRPFGGIAYIVYDVIGKARRITVSKATQERPADKAYETIRDGILKGRWQGGAHLTEQKLVDLIGISRTPIRDALRRLNNEGLVTISRNSGARVARWDKVEIDQIFDLRVLLEGHAAALAAEAIDDARLGMMTHLCDQMEDVVKHEQNISFSQLATLNDQFHAHILTASGNGRLGLMVRQITNIPLVLRTYAHYAPDSLDRSMQHHREIVTALGYRDKLWAQSLMQAHIRAGHAAVAAP